MKFSAIALSALAISGFADAKKPLVSSKKLQEKIKLKDLLKGSQKLQDFADGSGGNRVFGSKGHNDTVDYIVKTLQKTKAYNVYKQPFTELYSAGTAKLSVDGADVEAAILTYTPGGQGEGPLIKVANLGCNAEDFPAEAEGNVVFISRGECPFSQKSINAKEAGATAAIIYNNVPGSLAGTLGAAFGNYAPVVGISQESAAPIVAALEAGDVSVKIDIDAVTENRVSFNVIAETKEGDHDNVLILGGHTDSVAAGPGINDDGSGTIGVLNVAVQLAKFRVKNAVRFGFWSAEEFGLLGSYHYIKQINSSDTELAKIRAYLNFDMIASPNYIYGIYDGDGNAFNLTGPAGSDVLEEDFEKFYKKNKVNSVPTEFSGRSDYAAFIQNGIPSGGIFTGAEALKTEEEAKLFGGQAGVAYDVNYHKAGDDIKNLDHGAYLLNTKAIANSVAKYALSWKSLGPVNNVNRRWAADNALMLERDVIGHGHAHTHDGPCGGGYTH